MELDIHDVTALLAEVESFALQRITASTERPETTLTDETLAALSVEAAELGLVPGCEADAGFALWEHCDHPGSMAFNLGMLQHIGLANAGVAFAWHRMSLARSMSATLGAPMSGYRILGSTIATTGHYGLAQSHLGKFLAAEEVGEDDAVLPDWLDRRHPTTLLAPAAWEALLWPVWHDGQIGWQVVARDGLDVESCRAQHGLDELSSFRVKLIPGETHSALATPSDSRKLYERALKLDMLGLLAIGAGAIQRAWQYAAEYAAIRKQGGKLIALHPAVQQMLGEIEMASRQVDGELQRLARPVDDIPVAEVATVRATMHVALCHAANQSVQVFGGIGYMRDAGPEKIVRDQNMLRLLAGGLREIPLMLAGLSGGCA